VYDQEHMYITVIGDAYNGAERWQFGLRTTYGGVSNEATALALAPVIQSWWTATSSNDPDYFSPPTTHRLTELKVAHIQTDGLYPPDEASYSHFYLPPIAGTIAPPEGQLPQATLVATLLTGVPRGLASKGRIYLPPTTRYKPDVATGLIPSNYAQLYANNVMKLINAINATSVIGEVRVFSKGKGVKVDDPAHRRWEWTYPNPGVSSAVTAVRVGRVIDTQRRRRRQLGEQYVTDAV
jgi:hypothetical protein